MRRGTTPTVVLKVTGVDTSLLTKVLVTFKQRNGPEISKEPVIDGDMFKVTLTQEETISFKNRDVSIQMKAMAENGSVIASSIKDVSVEDILNEEVLQ